MANLFAYLIPAVENEIGLNGWAAIKKYESRLIPLDMIQTPTNADIASAIIQFTWLLVKDGKVYESHKKYIDLDNNRIIYTFYEVTKQSDAGTLV